MNVGVSSLYRWILVGGGLLVVTIGVTLSVSARVHAMPLVHSTSLISNEGATPSSTPAPSIEQQLQIEQLRQETSWEGRLRGYLPAGSALVALAAAGWGVFVYLRDQRRDLELRTRLEITNNLNRLIEYGKSDAANSAQVLSALTTIDALSGQSTDKDLPRKVTDIISIAITEDIDFNDVRQVRFEALCLGNWPPYEAHLKANPEERSYVLYRYLSALRELRNRHATYVSKVNWDSDAKKFTHPTDLMMEPENDFRLFQRLVQGIRSHWQLIDEVSQQAVLAQDFQAATGNPKLTTQLLEGPRS
jgi:hypothetical protein